MREGQSRARGVGKCGRSEGVNEERNWELRVIEREESKLGRDGTRSAGALRPAEQHRRGRSLGLTCRPAGAVPAPVPVLGKAPSCMPHAPVEYSY